MAASAGYRRVIRSIRLTNEHCKEVNRVANELGRRGLIDLADDLRMSVRKLLAMRDLKRAEKSPAPDDNYPGAW